MITKISVKLWLLLNSDTGATATEYGLLVCFIALVIVAGVGTFGRAVDAKFTFYASRVAGF